MHLARRAMLVVCCLTAAMSLVVPAAAASAPVSRTATSGGTGAAAASTSSRFVPLTTPQRLLDTRTGGQRRLSPNTPRNLVIAGRGGVPTDASAVALNVTVVEAATAGHLSAYPAGTSPATSNLNFYAHRNIANAVIEQLGSGGAITFLDGSGGSLDLLVDVTGYFAAPATDTPGGFVPMTPKRVLDTRYGTGAPKRPVGPKATVAVPVGGTNGIPVDASAVVLNVAVYQPTQPGHITAYPTQGSGPLDPPTASNLNFGKQQTVPDLVVVPIGDARSISLYNNSTGTLQLFADVFGYFTPGSPVSSGAFGSLNPLRALDTRPAGVAPGKTLTLHLRGRAGVPLTGVSAVALTVTATAATQAGHLTVNPPTTGTKTSLINFPKKVSVANFVIARLDPNGDVKIQNASTGTTQILADVAGFVRSSDLDPPTVSTSRYVSDLAAISKTGDDASEGCLDGASGAHLVLLDIGAQTTKDLPSPGGVVLTHTTSDVRVTYSDLEAALHGYLQEFERCMPTSAVTPRIAIGTNNEGAFATSDPNYYAPAQRGQDWADVVNTLRAGAPSLNVVGADDIESSFASTEAQAEQWVTSYLGNTGADFVFNGSLEGCPDQFGATSDNCGSGWTSGGYVRLTYGLGPGRISVLPQIYFANHPDQAAQWVNLFLSSGKKLTFAGSLTQFGIAECGSGCGYRGADGWAALVNALATVSPSPPVRYATNLVVG